MGEKQGNERTRVQIYGEEYTIKGTESSDHIIEVSNIVDEKMKELKTMNPYLDTKRLAVLTAVNIVNEYVLLKKEMQQLQKKLKEEE
ncbi:cell division protein ZapA [Pseudalkalibacillus caeni]|uniref:Cell division protein ZapA n=1 Tax=Exobacillus caeni TaxID=2574798 RepID=A0A5R9F800_9BACL|nr:cell division protein ZapA [Pseudalkalibacillus caeni]TLS39171.1 cell division protein ZapA [Pseudalkalibacillus caeni]